MQRVTQCLLLLLISHWGVTQSLTKLGCPIGCICQDLSASNPQYKVECQALPNSPLPPRTTEFKSKICPSNLTTDVFTILKPSFVNKLDLSRAKIINVGDGALGVFNKVTIIDLSHNEIQNIGGAMLRGCNRLEELRLSNNHIAQLGVNCFKGLFSLKSIYLDHNMIPEFPDFTPTLEHLDISYNEIKFIRNRKMIALQSLNVCGNTINDFSGNTFMSLHTICIPRFFEMDFTSIPIENVRLDYFPGHEPVTDLHGLQAMPNLMNFTIDGYQVSSFIWPKGVGHKIIHLALNHVTFSQKAEKEFLDNLRPTSVQSLDLSNSPQAADIFTKDSTVLDDLHDLAFVDLRSCNLTSLGDFKSTTNQIALDVSENPLHCDCSLAKSFEGRNIELIGNEALCASPDEQKNRPLAIALPDLCKEEPQAPGPDLPSKGGRPQKTKEFDQGTNFGQDNPQPDLPSKGGRPQKSKEFDQGTNFGQDNPQPDLPSKGGRPQKTKEFDQGTNFGPEIPPPAEIPHEEEQPFVPSQPQQPEPSTESDIVTIPEQEITEEFASEHAEVHTKPPTVDEDETAAFGHDEPKTSQTTYIIVGVVLALAFIGAIIFSVLFFYFRRRGHAGIENGNAQYKKHTSSRDNLVKGTKK